MEEQTNTWGFSGLTRSKLEELVQAIRSERDWQETHTEANPRKESMLRDAIDRSFRDFWQLVARDVLLGIRSRAICGAADEMFEDCKARIFEKIQSQALGKSEWLHKFETDGNVKSYVRTMAQNLATDIIRSEGRRDEVEFDENRHDRIDADSLPMMEARLQRFAPDEVEGNFISTDDIAYLVNTLGLYSDWIEQDPTADHGDCSAIKVGDRWINKSDLKISYCLIMSGASNAQIQAHLGGKASPAYFSRIRQHVAAFAQEPDFRGRLRDDRPDLHRKLEFLRDLLGRDD